MSLPIFTHDDGPSDDDLIAAVRAGRTNEFGQLWERHAGAARRYAFQCCSSAADADDLVSEAFTKVLRSLRSESGPQSGFRTYLLRTVRNVAIDRSRRDKRLVLSEDMQAHESGEDIEDPAVAELDRSLIARAFKSLPPTWQTVLWHTAVEGERPRQVAGVLGTSPHNVAALAYRAREGLRQAYLNEYAVGAEDGCRDTASKLGSHARESLNKRDQAAVTAHLDDCSRCRRVNGEVRDLAGAMRSILGPLFLGGGAAAYLAHHGTGHAAAAAWHSVLHSPAKLAAVGGAAAALALAVVIVPRTGHNPQATGPQPLPAGSSSVASSSAPALPVPGASTPTRSSAAAPRSSAARPTTSADLGPTTGPTRISTPATNPAAVPPPAVGPGSSSPTTRPSTSAPPPTVASSIGTQSYQYDATSVPLHVSNQTGRSGSVRITLTPSSGIELDDPGPCTNQGTATSPVLDCGVIGPGASTTPTVVLGSVPNSDGTFYSQTGSIAATATVNGVSGSSSAATEIRCEPPYS